MVGKQSEADFRGWVSASRDGLRRTAFLLCGDWFLADDLVQDALARVFVRWDRVAAVGDPTAYARRVMLNLYLDHRRRPSRRESPRSEVPDVAVLDVAAVDGERERLIAALRVVPPGQRAVLVLRYWDDLSIEQTAHLLGTSTGNVKSQASRGLDALRAALAGDAVTEETT